MCSKLSGQQLGASTLVKLDVVLRGTSQSQDPDSKLWQTDECHGLGFGLAAAL